MCEIREYTPEKTKVNIPESIHSCLKIFVLCGDVSGGCEETV